jgi:uncharacterized protein
MSACAKSNERLRGEQMSTVDDIKAAAERVKAEGKSKPRSGRHPVNQPMVDHWLDAMGDKNPIYVDESAARAAGHPGVVAPPAMIQVWTMMGLGGVRPDDDPLGKILELFDEAGYIGVVATNCEQTYHRYLRPGEEVSVAAELTDVVGPKRTALGEGFFITQKISWTVGDDVEGTVAEMMWRIMKFRPAEADQPTAAPVPDDLDADSMMRPASSRDTKFFWDGVDAHELRIQKRGDGSLQHPPVPALWLDKEAPTEYVVASGKGTVFSFVVHHAPKVPGRTLPFVIALVELEEGVRMLGELRNIDPATVEVGMPVRAMYIDSGGGHQTPRAVALRRPDVHRVDGDRHPRLPGCPPRQGQGAGQGFQGHLRQHPHRHRFGAALHHRLGGTERGDQVDLAAAGRAVVRLRHGDLLR